MKVKNMDFMARAKKLLENHEGYRRKPYRCTEGKLTIGIGRNIEDVGISRDEAEYMLSNDLRNNYADLCKRLPFFATLPESKQLALISMSFMGMETLMTFKNMFAELSRGNWEGAAAEALDSKWAKQVQPSRVEDVCNLLRSKN